MASRLSLRAAVVSGSRRSSRYKHGAASVTRPLCVLTPRRAAQENPRNYDVWFDYAKLEEKYGATADVVRDVYEVR